jgi:hypothetical protein
MMNRRNIFCAIAMCAISMPVLALPIYNSLPVAELSSQFLPTWGSGQALVTSSVYSLTDSSGFLYTYRVSGSTAKFTWFSVALNPGTLLDNNSGYESPGTLPFEWLPVEDFLNPTSFEAFFNTGLTFGNSALLWFTSPNNPDSKPAIGALAKLSASGGTFAEGNVLVPVPEPLTMTLLGFGWLALRSCKRKG